ncbi:MAG: fibrobacter succinogenes major paralogous domain-containing protein [Bacteroidales bacterium]|jgi:uncharacterized protein (TIGR02145 family)|nr:fibrobacter succinogenes major paralogous domain-containing protein [Bacteroidales bacterium]
MSKQKLNIRNMIAATICFAGIILFSSCDTETVEPNNNVTTTEISTGDYVKINGVQWATRNVDAAGTFVANPEDAGMFYLWNNKKAWATSGNVSGWGVAQPTVTAWEKANDPSPAGYRVPTIDELKTLLNSEKVSSEWTSLNGVVGRVFTDKANGNSIFMPAAGVRSSNGTLENVGKEAYFWSATWDSGEHPYTFYGAFNMNFNAEKASTGGTNYEYGHFIRSVVDNGNTGGNGGNSGNGDSGNGGNDGGSNGGNDDGNGSDNGNTGNSDMPNPNDPNFDAWLGACPWQTSVMGMATITCGFKDNVMTALTTGIMNFSVSIAYTRSGNVMTAVNGGETETYEVNGNTLTLIRPASLGGNVVYTRNCSVPMPEPTDEGNPFEDLF